MKNHKGINRIVIQLDNNIYHPLLELYRGKEILKGETEITTVKDYQTSGVLSIYIKKHIKKAEGDTLIKIGEIEVNNIPPARAGEPIIKVTGKLEKNRYLSIEITIANTKYTQQIFDLHRYLKKPLNESTYIGLFIILLIILTLIVLPPGGKTKKQDVTTLPHANTRATTSEPTMTLPSTNTIPQEKKSEGEKPHTSSPTLPAKTRITITKETLYFYPDSYRLREQTKQKLENLLPALKQFEYTPGTRVKIYGHCALYGTEKGRYKLSYQRAVAVYKYLLKRGWKPEIKPEIKGWGGTKPVTRDPKKQNLNRRVEIIFPHR